MPDQLLRTFTPWLLGLFGLATAVALLVAVHYLMQVRQSALSFLRERSRRKLRSSLAMTALFALLAAGTLLALRRLPEQSGYPDTADVTLTVPATPVRPVNSASMPRGTDRAPSATPPAGSSPTAPFIPTNTPTLTPSATFTPSVTPSFTPTPSRTPTPSPTVPVLEAIYTPVTPYATPPADAWLGPLTVSAAIAANGVPSEEDVEFQEGQRVLYVSFDYDDMLNGILWRYIWFKNGEFYAGGTRVWEWQNRGRTYFYLLPPGGFSAGWYDVQVLLEEDIVRSTRFVIRER